MVFNEILIPQDPFTETNVTRKRSVVGNPHLSQKNTYFIFHKRDSFLEDYLDINFVMTQNKCDANINTKFQRI